MTSIELRIVRLCFSVGGMLMGLLLACNVFFIKRLVDELDATKQQVASLKEEVVLLQYQVSHCKNGEN